MSRIGKAPITIPNGTTVTIDGNNVSVKGPKGELSREITNNVVVTIDGDTLTVSRANESKKAREQHGLYRTLINNMIVGCTDGYAKTLEIAGVGYRAAKQGNKLVLTLGFSHPVEFEEGNGITFEVQGNNKIIVHGIDKEVVGQIAAEIRFKRKAEPYKGKGIKYEGERIKRKEGKAGSKK